MRPLRIAFPLLSVLVTLVVAEGFLRWAGFGSGAVELHSAMLQYDPQLGWAKTPGASVSYRWLGARIVETSNSEGARGPEHGVEPPDGRRRVLLLGDSFCEGYLVSDDQVFSAQLEAMAPVEAVNLGVAGYSTDQQLLLYRRVVDRYRPQQTVLLFFDNDVWFNALAVEHRSPKPLFEFDGTELRLTGVPVPPPDPSSSSAPSGGRAESLRLLRVFTTAARQAAQNRSDDWQATLEPANEFLLYRRDPPENVEAAWRLTDELLGRLDSEVEQASGRLTVLYVPNVAAVSDDSLAATRALYGMSSQEWDLRLVERRLEAVCRRRGIPFISPVGRLRARREQGETLYFASDGHWTADGHRAVAQILAQELQ